MEKPSSSAQITFDAHGKKIGIFVIAYNAESHIQQTLQRIPESVWKAISVLFIIDDCSSDDTVIRALEFNTEWKRKIVVLRNRVNKRYGGNQKLGYQYAIDKKLDAVVMLHADGQYAPEVLPAILDPLVKEEADIVFGSRMSNREDALKGQMPFYKFLGNITLTKIQNSLSRMDLSEFHSGYRAYSTKFLRQIPFWENSDEWHFDTQILFQANQCNARISEVPIPTCYGDEVCHVNGVLYGMHCILTSLQYRLFRRGVFYSRIFDISIQGRKYFSKFDDPCSSHSLILRFLQQQHLENKTILELGVGDASLTKRLHETGAIIDCYEIDAVSAQLARPYCRSVHEANLDDPNSFPTHATYDVVIAADVLEHLKNPEIVLSRLKRLTKRDGILVVSLPNVANIYVRLNVLLGRFPYHSKGILDLTHLHFYTLKTGKTMLRKSGWNIIQSDVSTIPIAIVFPFLHKKPFHLILKMLQWTTRLFSNLFGYQGIYYCVNPNDSSLL